MVTARDLISLELKILHRMQHMLEHAAKAASSHALKSEIDEQIIRLDQLETQFHILALQRGWNSAETDTAVRFLGGMSFRRRRDPAIAESLLRQFADDMIELLKHFNRWDREDASALRLFQNHMDCYVLCIKQLRSYL